MASTPEFQQNLSPNTTKTARPSNDLERGLGSNYKNRAIIYFGLAGVFLVVAILLLVLCLGFRADYKTELKKHNDYMSLIDNAINMSSQPGVVTGSKYNTETGLYAFTYRVSSGSTVEGQLDATSPYIYTAQQINEKFPKDAEVTIIIESGMLNQYTKSVPLDYENYDINTYPPYHRAQVGYITLLITTAIAFAIAFCFAGFALQSLYRSNKPANQLEDDAPEIVKPNGNRIAATQTAKTLTPKTTKKSTKNTK